MSEPTRGYMTLAVGKPRFLEMAVDMALSLREHTNRPVAIAVDAPTARRIQDAYDGVFDEVRLLDERFRIGRGTKYGVADASPFDETTFIDADCFVLSPLDHLSDSLGSHDMVMLGELLTVDEDENHHGFSTRRLMRRFDLDRYLKTNSGVFCFRRPGAVEVMEECLACYLNEARPKLRWSLLGGAWLGDEIAFGIVGGRRRLGTLPQPAPMYWPNEFPAIDLEDPGKPLLHMIWPPTSPVLERLLAEAAGRRRAAGVPGDVQDHWRSEVETLNRMVRRRRFLERSLWRRS